MFDKQAVFNRVVSHLRKQNARCLSGNGAGCAYRNGSLKCAVGALIDDADYDEAFEGLFCMPSVFEKAVSDDGSFGGPAARRYKKFAEAIKNGCGANAADDFAFLYQLQSIHDYNEPEVWEIEFRSFAEQNQLTVPSVSPS
jgi:hypothetical protein